MKLLEFAFQIHRLAVPLDCVRRVVAAAWPSPLPGAPDAVTGALNMGGEIVVMVDLGRRFGLAPSPLAPSQKIIVLSLSGFLLGIAVDDIGGVSEHAVAAGAMPQPLAGELVTGMVVAADGLRILIDPEQVLLRADADALRLLLEGAPHG